MRLLISGASHQSALAARSYSAAKRLIRENPVAVVQVVQPDPSRENLIGFLSWCNGRHCLPAQVVLNQVAPEERRLAAGYLLARGYRTLDRITFIKQ